MQAKNLSIIIVLAMVLSGCASGPINLVGKGTVIIERVPSRGVYFSRVYVKQNGNEIMITGRLKRRSLSPVRPGHVDIAIFTPGGHLLEKISTPYVPKILSARRGKHRGSRFEVRMAGTLPEGSKVRFAHHIIGRSSNGVFNCGENAALSAT